MLRELYEAIKEGKEVKQKALLIVIKSLEPNVESYEEFVSSLKERLEEKYGVLKLAETMRKRGIPWNKVAVAQLLNISPKEAAVIMKLSEALGLVQPIKMPLPISSSEDALYAYILAKGSVSFQDLSSKFESAREIILKLWKERKVSIPDLEKKGVDPKIVSDFDRVPLEMADALKGFAALWVSEDGKEYLRLEIPPKAKIQVRIIAEQGEG